MNDENLEKEIKDKNGVIEKLNIKIDRQCEDIKKLNDRLNVYNFIFNIGRKKF